MASPVLPASGIQVDIFTPNVHVGIIGLRLRMGPLNLVDDGPLVTPGCIWFCLVKRGRGICCRFYVVRRLIQRDCGHRWTPQLGGSGRRRLQEKRGRVRARRIGIQYAVQDRSTWGTRGELRSRLGQRLARKQGKGCEDSTVEKQIARRY
ncbi:hypothetical protein FIBSPDRAFT_887466 [Athelia psychrophila]|uniref:Uncharacterized protein n=1 Tax=Athelia psychrophila TaxID=1759441 RepID=A0A166PRV3_9AGAM|nr:hypothetical protein FIBSPDRAFT_887466 [Fibularhizoctonia sp. CBS 109695]